MAERKKPHDMIVTLETLHGHVHTTQPATVQAIPCGMSKSSVSEQVTSSNDTHRRIGWEIQRRSLGCLIITTCRTCAVLVISNELPDMNRMPVSVGCQPMALPKSFFLSFLYCTGRYELQSGLRACGICKHFCSCIDEKRSIGCGNMTKLNRFHIW